MFSLCETFLTENKVIDVEGYVWFGHNRRDIDKNATRGSGGVGILIKNEICNHYYVDQLNSSLDGILWLKLRNKHTEFDEVMICTCYCPPPSSSRGNLSQEFFDHLLTDVYAFYDRYCPCIITGDFNARIGDLQDFDNNLDILRKRSCIDKTKKNQEPFSNFLNGSQFCVLNGRFDTSKDNFTSISSKGCAVVDYMCTSYGTLQNVSEFSVTTVRELISNIDFQSSELSALPDHSVLTCLLNISPYSIYDKECNQKDRPRNDHTINRDVQKRYKVENVNVNMFANTRCKQALLNIINNIDFNVKTQSEMNTAYSNFIELLHAEMDKHFKKYDCSNKRLRTSFKKPWWNENLKKLFQDAQHAERAYIKCKKSGCNASNLRHVFVNKRKQFDREYRRDKRTYMSTYQTELSHLRNSNPKKFWNEISNLGPQKKYKQIPQEVILDDGKVTSNLNEVLEKWENDYKNLFDTLTPENNTGTTNDFIENVKETLSRWDSDYRGLLTNMNNHSSSPGNITNDSLNGDITIEEVSNAIKQAKMRKAVGYDNVPNEVLKCNHIEGVLQSLFNKCLHFGMVPNLWSQTLILPIAKPGKDPRMPTNCRGISLISTVSKVFSTILNLRLVDYLDSNNILCEEQNGFRKLRSCIEHIYTLSTIVKMKKKSNKPVFACFIDFSKAFDSVHRDLLWFRLLKFGIDGKFLQVLRAMYTNLQACVKLHNHLTNWFDSYVGVRQGDNLSPTLFNLFVNDLATKIKELNCGVKIGNKTVSILLYADDIVLISDSEKSLQDMLNTINSWCQKWQLSVYCSKTQVIHFRKLSDKETEFEFKLGEKCIEKVQKYRYLGVELNSTLNFTETVETLANASSRSMGGLIHKHFKINGLQPRVFKEIYEATACKIMDYGAAVWGGLVYDKHGAIYHRAMGTILGVRQ